MARPFPFLRFLPVFCALIAGPVHGQSAPAPAGPGPLAPPAVVVAPSTGSETLIGPIKFGDITVDAALEMLERWSGRSVLRPAGLPATSLSFSLNQKVTRDEARQALETLLALNGIAVSPLGGKFLKVTPLNVARTETPNFIEGSTLGLPATGGIASKLFQLKFLRVGEFSPQLAGMINAAAGAPVIFDKSNSILVTDTIANLQRVETLLAQLDQPSFEGLTPKFYKIHNSTASALVTKLQSLLSGNAATQIGTNTSYQADDRTNQIILLSDPRQQPLFDDLINRLDSAGESSTRQEVIPLKHATATEVATLLSSLISGQNSVNSRAGGQQNASQQIAAARNAAVAAINAANARNAGPNGQNNGGPNGAANRPVINQPPVVIANGFATPNQGDISQQFSTILTVVADDRSNALVVSGTVDDLRLIKDIVTQLDVLLAQVRIEVVIAEITLTDAASTGIGSLGLVVSGNKLVGFNGSGPGFGVGGAPDASGNATPYATLTRNLTGGTDLAGTLNLTTTPRKSNTNILSVPNIVTTHNKEATIFVGESRPVITSYQNSGVATGTIGSGYTSNVTYKDIGIRLTVKPLIGNDGSVQLDIKQEVNDILDNVTIDGNSQPVIGSRTTESFVSVNSNEIVVLGGLQRKAQNKSTSRLGGIPIIGDLLGTRTREVTRTDLVFFLRPYVLTNTAVDNHEALDRLKDSPQQKDIQSALQGTLISKPLNPARFPVITDDTLPAALASRLPEAARKALQESVREKRLALLASGLGLGETGALDALAKTTGLPVLEAPQVDRESLGVLPTRLAHEFQVVPVLAPDGAAGALHLATPWPPDATIADWIATFTPRPLAWHLAPADRVQALIHENYGVGSGSLDDADESDLAPASTGAELEADADAAVVRFVTAVISQAVTENATDIHFEPQEGELAIRYRVDGLLVPVPVPENLLRFQDAIISRLKIMARMNISERRLPQDGRIDFRADGAALDIRVSTIPTIYAESVSLRLLNQRKMAYTMEGIGLTSVERAQIEKVLDYPHGIILVTGPTGSGKSTSLNAFLRKINSPDLRIVTIEDPIEYEVPGANQMQTHAEIGLTFASALRHVLRQDPDVIMVGEIRDLETAEIAIRASLTGHLVFSTLHTNDAPGALTRLTDMGVEPFLVASAVELVIAQRLVRRLCPDCAKREPVNLAELRTTLTSLQVPPEEADGVLELAGPVGCRSCRQTGFRGRIGLFEILQPKPLHDLIIHRESSKALGALARSHGMRTLAQSGWERVKAGQTSLPELLRTISSSGE